MATMARRTAERDNDLARWRDAVDWCNAFLESPERQTLPKGRITLSEEGMIFTTTDRQQPIRIRCTFWGDFLIPCKMAAQERSDGFVVGLVKPGESRLLDNSFFKYASGRTASSASMASLILHELTHSYLRLGTVDFPRSISYYAEVVFLWRYRNHSQERLPYRTSAEFEAFFKRSTSTP